MVEGVFGQVPHNNIKEGKKPINSMCNGCKPNSNKPMVWPFEKIQTEVGIVSPAQIWSGDETGVQNVPKEIKVLGIKNIRTFQQVSLEQGEMSTILSFVNTLENVVPPNDYLQRSASAGYLEDKVTWQHLYFSYN